jgi:ribosome-associated toxin RatA of RatAB toxin-antitoxin module
MARVDKSVLVSQPASRMFALVDDVEAYPAFLPWCGGARVLYKDSATTVARIDINYHHVRQSFTTRNHKQEPHRMDILLEKGPFKRLAGHWRFVALGTEGCRVEFSLEYEFASRIWEKLFGPAFNYIANTLVDAFVKRARTLYAA